MRDRLEGDASVRGLPIDLAGTHGVLVLARRGPAFDAEALRVARLATELMGLRPAARLERRRVCSGRRQARPGRRGAGRGARRRGSARAYRPARRTGGGGGGRAALAVARGGARAVAGSYGTLEPDDQLARAAREIAEQPRTVAVQGDRASGQVVTVQLGEPALGSLQLRFASGRAPRAAELDRLAGFAVRAAHALRAAGRAREAATELERSRALLSVVGEAISRPARAHARYRGRARRRAARHEPGRRLPARGGTARGRRQPRGRGAARGRRGRSARRDARLP